MDGSRSEWMLRFVGKYCAKMEDMNEDVEPLPLVPAMCMGFRRSKSEGYSVGSDGSF